MKPCLHNVALDRRATCRHTTNKQKVLKATLVNTDSGQLVLWRQHNATWQVLTTVKGEADPDLHDKLTRPAILIQKQTAPF